MIGTCRRASWHFSLCTLASVFPKQQWTNLQFDELGGLVVRVGDEIVGEVGKVSNLTAGGPSAAQGGNVVARPFQRGRKAGKAILP